MRPELRALASTQGGVFLRRHAIAAGYTPEEVRYLLRRRIWHRVRHGAYVERELFDRLDDTGRARLLVYAVALVLDQPGVFTHSSASLLLDLPTYGTDLNHVHLTRSGTHCGRIVAGVSYHEATLDPADIVSAQGLHTTSLDRTPLDVAREYDFDVGVVCADAALRAGADPVRMVELARQMRCWPGGHDVLPVARFADAGAESPGESLARIFVVSMGFPPPQTQFVIRDGSFTARADMKLRGIPLLIEFDGRMKYRRTRDACDSVADDGEIVWAEKQREDELRGLDYGVFRLIWAELFGHRRAAAGRRLLRVAEQYGASAAQRRAV